MMIVKMVVSGLLIGFGGAHLLADVCKPKMEIGQTYAEVKLACPDLANQAYDRDSATAQVWYLCKSQNTAVIGDLRTGKMVGFMMTPERQDFLRDSVLKTRLSSPLLPSK